MIWFMMAATDSFMGIWAAYLSHDLLMQGRLSEGESQSRLLFALVPYVLCRVWVLCRASIDQEKPFRDEFFTVWTALAAVPFALLVLAGVGFSFAAMRVQQHLLDDLPLVGGALVIITAAYTTRILAQLGHNVVLITMEKRTAGAGRKYTPLKKTADNDVIDPALRNESTTQQAIKRLAPPHITNPEETKERNDHDQQTP